MAQRTERAVLNHLIETCTDAARGFRSAADHVTDPALKTVFTDIATQREQFATVLRPHAQRLGGPAAIDGTTAAAVHRGWIEFVAKLRHDDRAIVAEAARGDSVTMHVFEDAIQGLLPPDAREIVERQYLSVSTAHSRVAALNVGAPVVQ